MSLYNLVNGTNPATFFLLPMLGKHYSEYPRFRDCFPEENCSLAVYTRVGGNNRETYAPDIAELQAMKGYVRDFDDEFDSTYATFIFKVPKKYEKDYKKIVAGNFAKVSKKYREVVYNTYPDITDKLKEVFKKEPTRINQQS